MDLCHHYETSIYAQTHAQDIHASLASLHITNWKRHISFLSQSLGVSMAIDDQESPAIHKNMLSNALHLNANFFQIDHLDRLSQP